MTSLPVSTSQFQLRGDRVMADSGVINSRHERNSVQSLLQCPFERRTLADKLKVKELGPDQPDGFIYCE